MLRIAEKTEPFVATSVGDILSHITAHVPKGYFHYSPLRSWDDTAAFDLEVVEEIERIKWAAQGVGIKPSVKYLRIGKTCLLLSTEASFFSDKCRYGDIRQTPVDFDGYRISCKETEIRGVYETSISFSPGWLEMHRERQTRMACKDSVTVLAEDIRRLLEVRSPEIIGQVESILGGVNEKRKEAGLEVLSRAEVGLAETQVIEFPRSARSRDS